MSSDLHLARRASGGHLSLARRGSPGSYKLGRRMATITSYTITSDPLGGTLVSFGTFPAGTYTVSYVTGAWIDTIAAWQVVGDGGSALQVHYSGGATVVNAPGAEYGYPSDSAVVAASAGSSITISHTGGTIGIQITTSTTYNPVAVSGTYGAPKYTLS